MGRFVAWTPPPSQGRRGSDLGDGLTWELVDGATGASQSLQGRCFPRRAHRNSRGDPIVYKRGRSRTATIDEEDEIDDQEEEHLGSDNEEREQDEDDDANVTDNEDSYQCCCRNDKWCSHQWVQWWLLRDEIREMGVERF